MWQNKKKNSPPRRQDRQEVFVNGPGDLGALAVPY
jgi:hypothetical protein